MSDFLNHLIDRATPTLRPPGATLQPRLPSLFEDDLASPGAPAQTQNFLGNPRIPATPAVVETQNLASLRQAPRPDHASGNRLEEARYLTLATPTSTLPAPVQRHPDASQQGQGLRLPDPSPAASTRRDLDARAGNRENTLQPRPDVPAVERQETHNYASLHPVAQAAPTQQPAPGNRSAGTVQLNIHIGRVDVRAASAAGPAAAPARPAQRATPRLSLDDYLRQRNEGKR